MKWKQFLKPDWRKIVIFVILFISIPFIFSYFVYVSLSEICKEPGLPPQPNIPNYCHFSILDFMLLFIAKLENVILLIIAFYLTSCLVVWVYDKVKKK